jgi:hypothetical protein
MYGNTEKQKSIEKVPALNYFFGNICCCKNIVEVLCCFLYSVTSFVVDKKISSKKFNQKLFSLNKIELIASMTAKS